MWRALTVWSLVALCSHSASAVPGQSGACCSDSNQDGIPDSCSVLSEDACAAEGVFQGTGSACLGTGACCFGITGGGCLEIDGTCCDDLLGKFLGVGTACHGDNDGDGMDDACTEQACCVPEADVTCFMGQPEVCLSFGGSPQGPGSTCLGHEACCLGDGACLFVDRLCCIELGGQPGGPGSMCAGDGACCMDFDDGPLQYDFCNVVDGACCGGAFQGIGSSCNSMACCLADGYCQETDPQCCIASGGEPSAGSCAQAVCDEAIGACCLDIDDGPLAYDTCEISGQQACLEGGGVFQGPGSTCEFLACCLPGGGCQETDPQCCVASGGEPSPGSCAQALCDETIGACCLDIDDGPLEYDTCTVTSAGLCPVGGVFQGTGTTCVIEACCLPNGFCQDADPECCTESGGVPQGSGSTCGSILECPVDQSGACCLDGNQDGIPDGCFVGTTGDCENAGGIFQGPGSACQGTGACCFGIAGGGCVDIDGACCDEILGQFQGVGSMCLGDGDDNGLDDACESMPCKTHKDCADRNGDGRRDNACTWWACEQGECAGVAVEYADFGGANGVCPPDHATDANDRFHGLNCFSNQNTLGEPGYQCEGVPPEAYNVDAAGQNAPCIPDGVCDGHEAFAALNGFSGTTTCTCSGPAPLAPRGPRDAVDLTAVLKSTPAVIPPGGVVEVEVFLDDAVDDLRGYQLHFGVSGGRSGTLELTDLAIRPHDLSAFAAANPWQAFNLDTQQLVAGLDNPGVPTPPGAYLATLTFRASAEADGAFVVDLRHDTGNAADRTTLFTTPGSPTLAIGGTRPATIRVEARRTRAHAPLRPLSARMPPPTVMGREGHGLAKTAG